MKVSPHCHPESPLTGSTLKSLVKRAKELGREYFAYTDNGHLSSALKSYNLSKEEGLKFIAGIEIYFKDIKCPVISGSSADRCKYFTTSIYCRDQEAYQELCKMVSRTDFSTIRIRDEERQLWTWEDLEHISKFNVVVVLGGIHCMVGKVFLSGNPFLSEQVFVKLKDIFGDRLYASLFSEPWAKKYNSIIEIDYTDGTKDSVFASDQVSTDRARKVKASELADSHRHKKIKSIMMGLTNKEVNKEIKKAILHKGFLPLPGGDAALKVNKLLKGLSMKYPTKLLVTDYAYYSNKEDKIVQTMQLEGNDKLQANLHMKTEQEFRAYLTDTMKLSEEETSKIIQNNNEWASLFDDFSLKYEWRLAEVEGSPIQLAMDIIKKNGRMRWDDPIWVNRLKEELEVIAKNPKKDLTAYFLPIRDVLNHYTENGQLVGPGRGCLTGDAKVLTTKGFKNLKDVALGDKVFSHTGNVRSVIDTMKYDVNEALLEIKSNFSFGNIKLTKDHKLLGVKTQLTEKYKTYLDSNQSYEFKKKKFNIDIDSISWLKAENFSVNDYLFTPWIKDRLIENIPDLDMSKFCSNIVDLGSTHFSYGTNNNYKILRRYLRFDKKMCKIIGRWIGDGWINSNQSSKKFGIAFHSDDTIGQEDFFAFMSELGFSPTKFVHPTKKLVQIIINSAILHNVFRHLFPEYKMTSDTKYLGSFLNIEDSLLRELLIGLKNADGHTYRSNNAKGIVRESIDTTSERMAHEIKQALLYLKIPSSVNVRKEYIHPANLNWHCNKSYKIRFKGLTVPMSTTLIQNGDGYFSRISSISETSDDKVYDITVEKDHSYVTSNYVVHNSAGGSLLAYLLGITQISPFKYDLPFSRFFSLERIMMGKLPDIDVDLEDRELLVGPDGKSGYLYGRWGDKAAQISTRTKIRLKSAIKDVNRYMHGKVQPEIETFTKGLPAPPPGIDDIKVVFGYEDKETHAHVPGLIEISDDLLRYSQDRPNEWAIVEKSMGITRAFSQHASAFVLSDIPIKDIVPVKDHNITQYEAKECEKAGLIKYDFLVVKQLKDIRVCLDLINKKNGDKMTVGHFKHNNEDTYIWNLPEIKEVMQSVWDGSTETCFQINSKSMTPFVMEILPEDVMDLATILALVRPGPLDFVDPKTGRTMAEEYVKRRKGESEPDIQILADILPKTYGIFVYQEDLTKIAKELAGFPGNEAELLRENMAKKKTDKLKEMRPKFVEGASKKVPKETAEEIWNQMETFGRYGFSIIHAVEYAHITYACMFLKHFYRLEWWTAVLSNAEENKITGEYWPYVREMVKAPDINLSSDNMVVDYANETIRAKFGVIRGLGEKSIEPIVEGRPYKDIQDFVDKDVAGNSLSHKLIHVGVLDSLFRPKSTLIEKLRAYEQAVENKKYADKVKTAKEKGKTVRSKGPKEGQVPAEYIDLHPLVDAAMRKSTLPTMPIDLHSLGKKYSKVIMDYENRPLVLSKNGHRTLLLDGDKLRYLDDIPGESVTQDRYVAATCFVIKAEEFSFAKGTKRALKLVLDADGYISEKVLWPQYETGILEYPVDLKKGSIVTVFFKKRAGKKDMNIMDIVVES